MDYIDDIRLKVKYPIDYNTIPIRPFKVDQVTLDEYEIEEIEYIPAHFNLQELISIFGRTELKTICEEKLTQLNPIYEQLVKEYAAQEKLVKPYKDELYFLMTWIDVTVGADILKVKKEIERNLQNLCIG